MDILIAIRLNCGRQRGQVVWGAGVVIGRSRVQFRPPPSHKRDLFLGSPEFKSLVSLCK